MLPRGLRRAARTTVALLALWSVFVTAAITLHFQNEIVWGVPDDVKARYHSLRQTADAFFGFTPHDR